ncbi:MAG: hypothetical protein KF714_08815 [Parvibaculum sp.]|nr:hypothetical protein [Parvibaculum sp.]
MAQKFARPIGLSLAMALCLGLAAPAGAQSWDGRGGREDGREFGRGGERPDQYVSPRQEQAIGQREPQAREWQRPQPQENQAIQYQQAERQRDWQRQQMEQQAVQQERQRSQYQQAERQRDWQRQQMEQQAVQQERQRSQYQQAERQRDWQRQSGHQQVAQLGRHAPGRESYERRYFQNQTQYTRPYTPVYADRPWYGWHGSHKPPSHGPVIVYRNVNYFITIPQPVYVHHVHGYSYSDYYYSGPYAGYDSVYRYDSHGYGYRYSACNSDAVGAAIGAVLGGVIGADQGRGAGPVIGGALIGAVLGGVIGSLIDSTNQACVGDVLEYVPSNQSVYWQDPDSGYGYEVTPLRTWEPNPGQYCREYQTVVTIGGRAEQAYGYACRQPDGSWQVMNS